MEVGDHLRRGGADAVSGLEDDGLGTSLPDRLRSSKPGQAAANDYHGSHKAADSSGSSRRKTDPDEFTITPG